MFEHVNWLFMLSVIVEHDASSFILCLVRLMICIVWIWTVLSNSDKRFLYDLGVYDCDDDNDENVSV